MKPKLTFVLELTKQCNNNCKFCYNVWKADDKYPTNELDAHQWKQLIDKIFNETQVRQIALSGGEPLMKNDFQEILKHINKKKVNITLITNGTLLDRNRIRNCLKNGVKQFELPLLGDNEKIHDSLTNNLGSWRKVINNCREIKKQGGNLAIVFIITKQNAARMKEVMEIAIALDAEAILANRFNVGGAGIRHKEELSPTLQELIEAYKKIDKLAEEYEIRVNSGIPVPKCIIDTSQFNNINFFNCPHGGEYAYYAIDPAGNIRPCNHSKMILGSLLNKSLTDIINSEKTKNYFRARPLLCHDCSLEKECGGGCLAAAEVYYRDNDKPDPFVADNFKSTI